MDIATLVMILLGFYFYLWIGILMVLLDPDETRSGWRKWHRRLAMLLFWCVLWPLEFVRDRIAEKILGRQGRADLENPTELDWRPVLSRPMTAEAESEPDTANMAKVDAAMAKLLRQMEDENQRRRAG